MPQVRLRRPLPLRLLHGRGLREGLLAARAAARCLAPDLLPTIALTKERAMTRKCSALMLLLLAAAPGLAAEPNWQPVLTNVLRSEKSARLCGVVVNHDVGCVFVDLGD